jgi:hypothetical protein
MSLYTRGTAPRAGQEVAAVTVRPRGPGPMGERVSQAGATFPTMSYARRFAEKEIAIKLMFQSGMIFATQNSLMAKLLIIGTGSEEAPNLTFEMEHYVGMVARPTEEHAVSDPSLAEYAMRTARPVMYGSAIDTNLYPKDTDRSMIEQTRKFLHAAGRQSAMWVLIAKYNLIKRGNQMFDVCVSRYADEHGADSAWDIVNATVMAANRDRTIGKLGSLIRSEFFINILRIPPAWLLVSSNMVRGHGTMTMPVAADAAAVGARIAHHDRPAGTWTGDVAEYAKAPTGAITASYNSLLDKYVAMLTSGERSEEARADVAELSMTEVPGLWGGKYNDWFKADTLPVTRLDGVPLYLNKKDIISDLSMTSEELAENLPRRETRIDTLAGQSVLGVFYVIMPEDYAGMDAPYAEFVDYRTGAVVSLQLKNADGRPGIHLITRPLNRFQCHALLAGEDRDANTSAMVISNIDVREHGTGINLARTQITTHIVADSIGNLVLAKSAIVDRVAFGGCGPIDPATMAGDVGPHILEGTPFHVLPDLAPYRGANGSSPGMAVSSLFMTGGDAANPAFEGDHPVQAAAMRGLAYRRMISVKLNAAAGAFAPPTAADLPVEFTAVASAADWDTFAADMVPGVALVGNRALEFARAAAAVVVGDQEAHLEELEPLPGGLFATDRPIAAPSVLFRGDIVIRDYGNAARAPMMRQGTSPWAGLETAVGVRRFNAATMQFADDPVSTRIVR